MLIYHPAEDSVHCCYRIIRLLNGIASESIPLATLMICDFYSLFPGQLKNIEGWPRANSAAWKSLKEMPNEYEEMLNVKRIFFQLKSVQLAAISHLHAKEILIISATSDKQIHLNKDAVPTKIKEMLETDDYIRSAWFKLITQELSKISLYGKRGLKSKTGLMEFVYD